MKEDDLDAAPESGPILRLLPTFDVGAAPGGDPAKVKRRTGRPRKIELRPTIEDLEHHAAVAAERDRFIDADALVVALERGDDTRTLLRGILREIVRESAALEFNRRDVEKRGRDSAQISSRRIDALKKVADIEIKLREIDGEVWNLSSERFQRLFALWVEKLTAVAQETLPPEAADVFMNRLASALSSWETDAAAAIGVK